MCLCKVGSTTFSSLHCHTIKATTKLPFCYFYVEEINSPPHYNLNLNLKNNTVMLYLLWLYFLPQKAQHNLKNSFYAAALQASAHSLQASAHAWQWSCSCLPHSSAQASHNSIHSCNKCLPCLESLANNTAAVLQTSAQSISYRIQFAIICTCSSCRHEEAQKLQAAIQMSSFLMSWSCGIIFMIVLLCDECKRCLL